MLQIINSREQVEWKPVGITAVALMVGAIGLRVGLPVYRQAVLVREIHRVGGTILETRPRGPEWLHDQFDDDQTMLFDEIVGVDLRGSQATDDILYQLQSLSSLERLWLDDTLVSDRGLSHLRSLTALQGLSLSGTRVTDAGLAHLKGLDNLQHLLLTDTQVTDAGVAERNRTVPKLRISR